MPAPKVPLGERPLAFIDTETTGLDSDRHEVIEIAIILQDAKGRLAHYQTKIQPERIEDADPKALEINGYAANPKAWKNAPLMSEVGSLITSTLRGSIVVGHNVDFDLGMLRANLQKAGCSTRLPYHKVDTMTLAYEHLAPLGLESLSLDRIRDFLGWSRENAHTAMQDAKDVRKFYMLVSMGGWRRRAAIRADRKWREVRERFGMKPIY